MPAEQGLLQFSPVKNFGLFSNHWLTNRLSLEPEWGELGHSPEEWPFRFSVAGRLGS